MSLNNIPDPEDKESSIVKERMNSIVETIKTLVHITMFVAVIDTFIQLYNAPSPAEKRAEDFRGQILQILSDKFVPSVLSAEAMLPQNHTASYRTVLLKRAIHHEIEKYPDKKMYFQDFLDRIEKMEICEVYEDSDRYSCIFTFLSELQEETKNKGSDADVEEVLCIHDLTSYKSRTFFLFHRQGNIELMNVPTATVYDIANPKAVFSGNVITGFRPSPSFCSVGFSAFDSTRILSGISVEPGIDNQAQEEYTLVLEKDLGNGAWETRDISSNFSNRKVVVYLEESDFKVGSTIQARVFTLQYRDSQDPKVISGGTFVPL